MKFFHFTLLCVTLLSSSAAESTNRSKTPRSANAYALSNYFGDSLWTGGTSLTPGGTNLWRGRTNYLGTNQAVLQQGGTIPTNIADSNLLRVQTNGVTTNGLPEQPGAVLGTNSLAPGLPPNSTNPSATNGNRLPVPAQRELLERQNPTIPNQPIQPTPAPNIPRRAPMPTPPRPRTR